MPNRFAVYPHRFTSHGVGLAARSRSGSDLRHCLLCSLQQFLYLLHINIGGGIVLMPHHLLCPRMIHPYQADRRLHVAHRYARLERALPSAPNPWFQTRRCLAYAKIRFLMCPGYLGMTPYAYQS